MEDTGIDDGPYDRVSRLSGSPVEVKENSPNREDKYLNLMLDKEAMSVVIHIPGRVVIIDTEEGQPIDLGNRERAVMRALLQNAMERLCPVPVVFNPNNFPNGY